MKQILALVMCFCVVMSFVAVQPCFADVKRQQTIILKFDDLGESNIEGFQKTIDISNKLGVKCSVGVIGSWIDRGTSDEVYDTIRQWYADGTEVWHHGYYHSTEEYSTNSYEQQKEDFTKTMNLLKEKCGINLVTFGSPYNNSGETTRQMIEENFPEIKTVLYTIDSTNSNPNAVYLSNSVKFESKTGVCIKFEEFVEAFKESRRYDYLVLQAHPGYWSDESFVEYEKIIKYLQGEGCIFKTPAEYTQGHLADLENNVVREKILEIRIDRKFLDFDVAGDMIDGVVMVPFRSVFEALGCEVSYDESTDTATAVKDGKTLSVTGGVSEVAVNGITKDAEVAPLVKEGRFLVPFGLVAETLGCYTYWNENMYTAVIISNLGTQEPKDGNHKIVDVTFNDYQYKADELGVLSYDGDETTVWSAEGLGKWICYDLGEVKDVTKASVMWNKSDERIAYYKVYISEDGENFELVYDGQTPGTNPGYEDVQLGENRKARYVKFECNGNSTSKWNAIKEIYIY